MRVNNQIRCPNFSCLDTRQTSYLVPDVDVDPTKVSILLISEAAPENPADYYYAGESALFAQTTLLAFQDAGAKVASIEDILKLDIYLATAVKSKRRYVGYEIDEKYVTLAKEWIKESKQ